MDMFLLREGASSARDSILSPSPMLLRNIEGIERLGARLLNSQLQLHQLAGQLLGTPTTCQMGHFFSSMVALRLLTMQSLCLSA